jgi:predicted ester cyclase
MSNRQTIGQALRCFADPSKRQDYFRLYSDDIVLHGYHGVEPGLEGVKQFYNAFWEVFPDAQVTVHEIIEDDETLVIRYVITGTQEKAFMGVAAVGRRIELPGISILHFKNGRCFERWTCSDSLLLLDQIRGSTAPVKH